MRMQTLSETIEPRLSGRKTNMLKRRGLSPFLRAFLMGYTRASDDMRGELRDLAKKFDAEITQLYLMLDELRQEHARFVAMIQAQVDAHMIDTAEGHTHH